MQVFHFGFSRDFFLSVLALFHEVEIDRLSVTVEHFVLGRIVQVFNFAVMFSFEMQIQSRKIGVLFPALAHVENVLVLVAEVGVLLPVQLTGRNGSLEFADRIHLFIIFRRAFSDLSSSQNYQ